MPSGRKCWTDWPHYEHVCNAFPSSGGSAQPNISAADDGAAIPYSGTAPDLLRATDEDAGGEDEGAPEDDL